MCIWFLMHLAMAWSRISAGIRWRRPSERGADSCQHSPERPDHEDGRNDQQRERRVAQGALHQRELDREILPLVPQPEVGEKQWDSLFIVGEVFEIPAEEIR